MLDLSPSMFASDPHLLSCGRIRRIIFFSLFSPFPASISSNNAHVPTKYHENPMNAGAFAELSTHVILVDDRYMNLSISSGEDLLPSATNLVSIYLKRALSYVCFLLLQALVEKWASV
jgi:hypothetical protein